MSEKLAIYGGKPAVDVSKVVNWPPIDEIDEKMVLDALHQPKQARGEHNLAFEKEFCEWNGNKYALFTNSGTAALHMCIVGCGIGAGDHVLVTAYSWSSSATCILHHDAIPIFVDINPETFLMDPDKIEAAITPRTKAVIPVHLFGSMADLDKILAIAQKHGIKVIEDCAHAHGGEWKGRGVGSWGDAGSWSFQQSKLLTSGEGGAITTNDEHLWEVVGRLSHIGYQRGAKQGEPSTPPPMGLICHNYRVTEFQAIILLDQLETLRKDTELRAKNADYLREKLEAIPGIRVQAKGRCATLQSYYMYGVMVDDKMLKPGIDIKQVSEALKAEGVLGFNRGWGNVMYRQRLWSVPENMYRIESNQVAEQIVYKQLLIAGLNWLMAEKTELDRFAEAVAKVMDAYRG